jgi:hypothetical protein
LSAKLRSFAQAFTTFDGILLTIVVFWLLAAVLDMLGGRYGRVRMSEWHFDMALAAFGKLWKQLNVVFVVISVLVCGGCLARLVRKFVANRLQVNDSRVLEIFCIILTAVLMMRVLLLCISAHTTIMLTGRIEAVSGVFFSLLLYFLCSAAYLLTDIRELRLLAPTVLVLLFIESSNPERPFAQGIGSPHHMAIINRWIDDVREAEAHGKENAVILVPTTRWPHPKENFGSHLSRTFFAHSVTKKRMNITLRAMAED